MLVVHKKNKASLEDSNIIIIWIYHFGQRIDLRLVWQVWASADWEQIITKQAEPMEILASTKHLYRISQPVFPKVKWVANLWITTAWFGTERVYTTLYIHVGKQCSDIHCKHISVHTHQQLFTECMINMASLDILKSYHYDTCKDSFVILYWLSFGVSSTEIYYDICKYC